MINDFDNANDLVDFVNGKQIQVSTDPQKPNWVPITAKDKVTLGSGGVELRLQ